MSALCCGQVTSWESERVASAWLQSCCSARTCVPASLAACHQQRACEQQRACCVSNLAESELAEDRGRGRGWAAALGLLPALPLCCCRVAPQPNPHTPRHCNQTSEHRATSTLR